MPDVTDNERQLLGAMLTSGAAIDDASEILTPSDFQADRHGVIFAAIMTQAAAGKPTDRTAVADTLDAEKRRVIGGTSYLAELTGELVTAANAAWHADQIKAASVRRAIRTAGEMLVSLSDDEGDPLDLANRARARIDETVTERDGETSNAQDVYEAIETLSRHPSLDTPWPMLTHAVGGWSRGMLYVVGARPGIGKTVFGIGALLDAARRRKAAVMVSLEMPKSDLYLRMLSATGDVDGEHILRRHITADDDKRLATAAADIAGLDLVVDDRSNLSLAQIRSKVRGVQRKREVGVLVIDYLGLVRPPADAPKNDRRVQVDHIARGMKNLARDLQIPVIALAQLNRQIEGRAVKRPTLSDLRESGEIEAAADFVILLHRDHDETPRDLNLNIAKNRHGPIGDLNLDFDGRYSRITDRRSRLAAV